MLSSCKCSEWRTSLQHKSALDHGRAAVDDQDLTRHERGIVAGEKTHRADKILRLLVAWNRPRPDGTVATEIDVVVVFNHAFGHGETRRDRVDRDAVRAQFACQTPRHGYHCALAGDVVQKHRHPL